jgi:hypothetical protein
MDFEGVDDARVSDIWCGPEVPEIGIKVRPVSPVK